MIGVPKANPPMAENPIWKRNTKFTQNERFNLLVSNNFSFLQKLYLIIEYKD